MIGIALPLALAALALCSAPAGAARVSAVTSITFTRTGGFVAHDDHVTVNRRTPARLRRLVALLPARLPQVHSDPGCADCIIETLTVTRGSTRQIIEWNNSPPVKLRRIVEALMPLMRSA